ncbi:MAG TPA: hypothetical protein VF062_23455 [Candidatus Limnocylindrales bacterium]
MAVVGRKPKSDKERRNRVAPVHDWAEVEDIPYTGERPRLPQRFRTDPETGTSVRVSWPARTKGWWDIVSRMPHCRLWSASDWEFAIETAEVHARFAEGTNATELRIRQKLLGTTADARRDLRIKYVQPKTAKTDQPADVVNIDDYRDLYG